MRFNRSVFVSFLLSYLLLMAMVVSVFAAFLTSNFSERKETLRSSHESTLIRASEKISAQLEQCMALMDEYMLESHLTALMKATQATDTHTRENILFLNQLIRNNISSHEIYKQIAFRFGKLDLVLSTNGTSEIEPYYQVYHSGGFQSAQAWSDWTAQLQPDMIYADAAGGIYMGAALPLIGTGSRQCAIIFRLDEQVLFDSLLSAQDLFSGAVAVCDIQGNPVYTLGNTEILGDQQEKNLYHFEVRDSENRFILRSVIAEESLFADASDALRFYIVILSLCILTGVIVSLVMSARFYQPVRRIASLVGGEQGEANELKHIEQSIQNIMDECERLNSSLVHHSDDLIECEFRRVVSGEASEAQAQELIERELAPGEQGMVSFVAVGIEPLKPRQACRLMETILSRQTRCRCFTAGRIVAGVAAAGEWSATKEQMHALYAQMSSLCAGTFCMAVSEIVYAPLALVLAHRQALDALDYGMLASGAGVSFADALPDSCEKADSGITLYDHLRLQDAIRSGDADEAMRTFRFMTEKYFPHEGVPLPWLKCRMFSLINTLVTSVSEIRSDSQAEPPVEKLLGCGSISEIIREAELYLQAVCSRMKNDTLMQTPSLCRDQIVEYIRAHHQDPNLSVASIAEHFGMSASYLSRLFKQTTGEGMLDTIHVVRLMHVKQLLRETSMSMHEIRVNAGYPSEQTMFRAFKRIEGMTPSQYRQMYRDGEDDEIIDE